MCCRGLHRNANPAYLSPTPSRMSRAAVKFPGVAPPKHADHSPPRSRYGLVQRVPGVRQLLRRGFAAVGGAQGVGEGSFPDADFHVTARRQLRQYLLRSRDTQGGLQRSPDSGGLLVPLQGAEQLSLTAVRRLPRFHRSSKTYAAAHGGSSHRRRHKEYEQEEQRDQRKLREVRPGRRQHHGPQKDHEWYEA